MTVDGATQTLQPLKVCGVVWSEDAVLRALWRHFVSGGWAPIPQVTAAGSDTLSERAMRVMTRAMRLQETTDRRIDMLLVRRGRRPGVGAVETLAVEVKVTRADFLNDVRHPEKQAPWRRAATRHAYAVPEGLVRVDEVPAGSGLIVVSPASTGGVRWVRKAPYQPDHAPVVPVRVAVGLLHRLGTLEARTRGWVGSDPAGGVDGGEGSQVLRAALLAAEKRAAAAERSLEVTTGTMGAWRGAYMLLAKDGHPCTWCDNPVKPLHPSNHGFRAWRHMNRDHDTPCMALEVAALEASARDAYNTATPDDRDRQLRVAHRFGRPEWADTEPWRAYLNHGYDPTPRTTGPQPSDTTP